MTDRREPFDDHIDTGTEREQGRNRPTEAGGTGADPAPGFDSEWISLDVTAGGVALVELRAGATYDWEFRSELRRACQTTSELDPDAIVLAGEPDAFSITDDGDDSGVNDAFGAEQELQATCDAAATLGAPVIAAPRGDVRGYGMALALCTDLRVGGESSEYGRAGVPPNHLRAGGVTKRLVATVGRDRAREFVTAGTTYDAETMADWGLLNYVVGDDGVVDRALALAAEFAERPTDAYEHMKHAVRAATTVADPGFEYDAGGRADPDRLTTASGDADLT